MPRFTRSDDLAKHLKKALDRLQAETLITTQAELGSSKVSPVDTGRFRSSWFASEGAGSGAVAPEGTDSPNTDATGLRVDASKTYTLQNALPYAQRLCVEDYAVSKPKNWFIDFTNVRVPKIQEAAARVVKQEFSL
jgi:hypothetical protein